MPEKPATVEEFVAAIPADARPTFDELRAIVRGVLPDAEEELRYGIPTLRIDGRNVVHYNAAKNHGSLYPVPDDAAHEAAVAPYRTGKGTISFPLDRPLPRDLIEKHVRLLAGL